MPHSLTMSVEVFEVGIPFFKLAVLGLAEAFLGVVNGDCNLSAGRESRGEALVFELNRANGEGHLGSGSGFAKESS